MRSGSPTSRPDLTVSLSLLSGSRVVARTPDQSFSEPWVVTSIGPVPLAFAPGPYTARLLVKDNVAKSELVTDQPFEIRP